MWDGSFLRHFGCSVGLSDCRCGGCLVIRSSAYYPLIPGIRIGGSPWSYREGIPACLAKRYDCRVWPEGTCAIASQTPGRDGGHGVMPGRKA